MRKIIAMLGFVTAMAGLAMMSYIYFVRLPEMDSLVKMINFVKYYQEYQRLITVLTYSRVAFIDGTIVLLSAWISLELDAIFEVDED